MKNLFTFFLNSKIFLSICVFSLGLSSQYILKQYHTNVLTLLFFGTFLSYNYQRLFFQYIFKEAKINTWFASNKVIVMLLIAISILIFCYSFLQLQLPTKIAAFVVSAISLLYPFLRRVPFLKIFLIAFSWSFSTLAFTYLESNLIFDSGFYFSLLSRTCFILSITIPFDIRDAKYDMNKINTIPLSFGVNFSKNLSLIFLFFYVLIDSSFYYKTFDLNAFFATIFCFLYTFFILKRVRGNSDNYFYSFWIESCSVSLLFFLIITSILL